MGTSSCISVMVVCEGCCDIPLGDPEMITVSIFNGSWVWGFFGLFVVCFFFILESGFILYFLYFSLNCASTKTGKFKYFPLYLLINTGTKTSKGLMFR